MSDTKVYRLMVLMAIFWSGGFTVGKLGVTHFPPLLLIPMRYLIAAPILILVLYIRQPKNWLPTRREWGPLLILGILGLYMYQVMLMYGLKYTTAINSSLITAMNPAITAILTVLLLGGYLSWSRAGGIILSFIGVLLIVTNGNWEVISQMKLNPGDIWTFASTICWAAFCIYSREVMQRYNMPALKLMAWVFAIAAVIALPGACLSNPVEIITHASPGAWISILYLAVFASAMGDLFNTMGIEAIGAAKATVFVNLVPIFAVCQSVLFLHEPFNWGNLGAATLIITGLFMATCLDKKSLSSSHIKPKPVGKM